jgi:hypothetical protein
VSKQRHEEFFKDYRLVAAFYNGQFRGKAWANKDGLIDLDVVGANLQEVVSNLKQAIQLEALRRARAMRENLTERHQEFLNSRGVPDQGRRPLTRTHRTSHCYNCKSTVDNAVDLECIACGWIICNECAACGCGYV